MLTTSLIIPTWNRPGELADCLHSVLRQSIKPTELIIVDDGDLGGMPLAEQLDAAGIAWKYLKKDRPGLTASRNLGIREARGEVVFFLDDDVVLETDYLEEILRVYEQDSQGKLGGVGGVIANYPPVTALQRVKYLTGRLFLVTGSCEGRIEPSGFCTDYGITGKPLPELLEVDFLPGGVCSFRREVFDQFLFSENYKGYGLGEDKDFSCRVSRTYRLLITPRARLDHFESPKMRPDYFAFGRMYMLHTWRFFNTYARKGPLSPLLFWWAVTGYLLIRTLVLLASPQKRHLDRLRGALNGSLLILRGRAPEDIA